MKSCNKRSKTVNTDHIMMNMWLTLHEDFTNLYGQTPFLDKQDKFLATGFRGFREISWPSRTSKIPPYLFKWQYQLENLFKRYTAQNDAFTAEQLEALAKEKFLATQVRIAVQPVRTTLLHRVLQEARIVCTNILGSYDKEEHQNLCGFGKRACLGTPFLASYIDMKVYDQPFTGSSEHINWFLECVSGDPLLQQFAIQAIKENRFLASRCLQYSLVPKSFKSLRGIMPNTLVGSYYTRGLGNVLELRLRNAGLDIRHLQKKHGSLVKRASKDRKLVTADLSAASDSLSLWLLRCILPKVWYDVITFGRAKYVSIDKEEHLLSSIVTMGLGQTFPLQTLIFYSLLRAIGNLTMERTFVSVYGDDLIYSSHLHKYVSVLFPKLHLHLNEDKTYVLSHFRESCGCDFYRGIDVRPFQPEGQHQDLSGHRLQGFLYQMYNGIQHRWDSSEVPSTLAYLRTEMYSNMGRVHQVPRDYPDNAGVKVERPCAGNLPVYYCTGDILDSDKKVSKISSGGSYEVVCFMHLQMTAEKRFVNTRQLIYLWEALRVKSQEEFHDENFLSPSDVTMLQWFPTNRAPKFVRDREGRYLRDHNGRRIRRKVPFVQKKGSESYREYVSSVPTWGWSN